MTDLELEPKPLEGLFALGGMMLQPTSDSPLESDADPVAVESEGGDHD